MKSNQNIIENKTNPPIYNQFQINTSQIINYYFNLSQYLNMSNNLNNTQSQNLPTNVKTENQPLNQQNSNQTLSQINNGALNQLINIGNMLALLQLHSTYQQYSLLMKNMNTNEKIKKYNTNLIGNKVNREIKDRGKKINNKINKNSNIKKNGSFQKNKKKSEKIFKVNNSLNNNIKEESKSIKEDGIHFEQNFKGKISLELKNEKEKKVSESGNNKKYNEKKLKNKTNKYKYLLQDSLLEKLDKPKKDISIVINNEEFEKAYEKFRKSEKKRNLKKKSNSLNIKKNKIKKNRINKFNLDKNTQLNYTKYPSTKCIFHGDNYEKTNSALDFMKYNYNLTETVKKSYINDNENKVVSVPEIIYMNNFENKNYNLSDIKPLWLRSKFNGDKIELNNCINSIKQKLQEGRDNTDEEKCLEKLFENPNLYK